MEQLWMLQWELSRAGKGVVTLCLIFCGHTCSSEERMRKRGEQKLCAPLKDITDIIHYAVLKAEV